jgi:uncharacterized protein (TIGR02186 family)
MSARTVTLVTAAALLIAAGSPAPAERLITSVSKHRVQVTSNFGGEDLVLFGAIERDAASIARSGGYDVVVTVSGPRKTFVTRRKERRLGIWINVDSHDFDGAPAFLAVLSNRPIREIGAPEMRRRLQIGLDTIPLARSKTAEVPPDNPFRQAFIRINVQHNLYQQSDNAVTFLTPNLFRAAIPLPASAPIGTYNIELKVLADGAVVARATSAFEVIKAGFEQVVAETAHRRPFLYGIATAMLALLTGWLASVIFRRD